MVHILDGRIAWRTCQGKPILFEEKIFLFEPSTVATDLATDFTPHARIAFCATNCYTVSSGKPDSTVQITFFPGILVILPDLPTRFPYRGVSRGGRGQKGRIRTPFPQCSWQLLASEVYKKEGK